MNRDWGRGEGPRQRVWEERIKASEIARSNASGFEPGVSQRYTKLQRGHLTRVVVESRTHLDISLRSMSLSVPLA